MSCGLVCQTKTANSCGHIPEHFAGQDKFSINESSFSCSLLALYDSDFFKKIIFLYLHKKVTVTIVKLKERYKYQQWTKIQEKEDFYNSNAQILNQIINFTPRKNLRISCVLILLQLWYILILSYINIGNRTLCRPIRTVIVLVIKQIGLSLHGHLILLITGMIYPY